MTTRLPQPFDRQLQTFGARSVEVLREMVIDGRLRAGERLNEVELAAALGISRGPLREAIARLASEGLLTSVANRGAFVRVVTAQALGELYEVRIALETHAVRMTAGRLSEDRVASLRSMLDDSDRQVTTAQVYPHELDFHRELVAVTGNQTLMSAATEVHRQIDLARSRSGHQPARARAAVQEHEDIFEHLVAGRSETAAKALAKHLRSSLASALKLIPPDEETSR